jgi:plasmid stability protein
MANLTISLDENLVKQARIKAIQEGTSLSAKVREMLAAYVRQDVPAAPAAIPQLPVSKATGGLMPGIDPSSNRSFYEAMEADLDFNSNK